MMLIEIQSWINGMVLHTIETDSFRTAIIALVKAGADLYRADLSGADLSGADLSGAYLSGANLSGAKIADLLCLNELSDAIDLAPLIWQEWGENGFDAAKKRFGLYQVSGEDKALIAMCPLLVGGFCFCPPSAGNLVVELEMSEPQHGAGFVAGGGLTNAR